MHVGAYVARDSGEQDLQHIDCERDHVGFETFAEDELDRLLFIRTTVIINAPLGRPLFEWTLFITGKLLISGKSTSFEYFHEIRG